VEQHCGHVPRRCSGRPNPPLACAQSISRLRLATANGRGFFGVATKDEKAKHLVKVANRSDLAGFQECHGTPAQVHAATKVLQPTHHIFWSSPVFENHVNLSSDKFCVPKPLHCSPNGDLCSDSSSMSSDGESDSSCSKSSSQSSSSCSDSSVFSTNSVEPPRSCAGGVLCTVRRSCFTSNASIVAKVWVPGRVLEISIVDNDKTFHFINMHFHGLTPPPNSPNC
jgi:hypothetical protein